MKMFYGSTPIKSMRTHIFDIDSSDATMIASDLQAGVTGYSKGKKITGTGKTFEFASYGRQKTNTMIPLPTNINIIEIACIDYPIQLSIALIDMKNIDFSTEQTIGSVIINGANYPITAKVEYNMLTIACSETVWLQVFYGKDNYV